MDGSENCSLVRWNPAAAPPRGVDKDAASSSPAVPRSREEIGLLSANLLSSMRKSVRAHRPVRGRARFLITLRKGPSARASLFAAIMTLFTPFADSSRSHLTRSLQHLRRPIE